MSRRLLFLLLLFVVAFCKAANAQSIERSFVGNAGATASAGNIIISYAIGEYMIDTVINNGTGRFLTSGFIQPDNDIQLSNTDISKNLIVFPNPSTNGHVKLSFNNLPDASYNIQVIDALGQILQTQTANYQNHNFYYITLDLSALKGGLYFIKVTSNLGFHGDVKIVKL